MSLFKWLKHFKKSKHKCIEPEITINYPSRLNVKKHIVCIHWVSDIPLTENRPVTKDRIIKKEILLESPHNNYTIDDVKHIKSIRDCLVYVSSLEELCHKITHEYVHDAILEMHNVNTTLALDKTLFEVLSLHDNLITTKKF